jgi:hypothetical protein
LTSLHLYKSSEIAVRRIELPHASHSLRGWVGPDGVSSGAPQDRTDGWTWPGTAPRPLRAIFGVPSFVIGDDMFFGDDRLDLLR